MIKAIAVSIVLAVFGLSQIEPMPTDIEQIDFNVPVTPVSKSDAYDLGRLAFHLPSSSFGSCASCHAVAKGGYSHERLPKGNRGHFDIILKELDPKSVHLVDDPAERTPPTLNNLFAVNGLNDGALGLAGINSNIDATKLIQFNKHNAKGRDGISTQVSAGFDAHNTAPIVEMMRSSAFCNDLAMLAFGSHYVTEDVIISAIAVYEKAQLPTESNFQKYLRGEAPLKHFEGYEIYKEKGCANCHGESGEGHKARGLSFAKDAGVGFFRVTKDSADLNFYKAPQLYNLKDAPGLTHKAQKMTIRKAVLSHTDVTRKEATQLQRFIKNDLYDPNLKRYITKNPYKN